MKDLIHCISFFRLLFMFITYVRSEFISHNKNTKMNAQPTVFNKLQHQATNQMVECKFTEHMHKLNSKWDIMKKDLSKITKSNLID